MFGSGRTFAVLLLLALAGGNAVAEPVTIDRKLNLRAGPGTGFGVITVLPEGARLDARKCGPEWCQVRYGRQAGYVSREFLKSGADALASAAPPPPPAESGRPTLTGPRVWQWRDRETRDRLWRDIEWHNRLRQRAP